MLIFPTGTSNRQAGFTLIELVVVMVLLSLVSFISLPMLMNRGEGQEKAMIRRIAGTVKQLYNESTLTREEHQLTFDLGRNSMTAYRLRADLGHIEKEPFGKELELAPLKIQQVDVEGQGSFRSGQVSIRIFPLGWMEETHIAVRRESGELIEFSFSPLTGTINIDEESVL